MNHHESIILMGPMASGKSSIAKAIANQIEMKYYPVDKLKWYYRFKNGYSLNKSQQILRGKGFNDFLGYSTAFFTANDIQDILDNFQGIVELGASDTHQNDFGHIRMMENVLEPYPNVFLILPYEDLELSHLILTKRMRLRYNMDPLKKDIVNTYIKKNYEFLHSISNIHLSKHVVYCNDRPDHLIAQEIIYRSVLNNTNKNLKNVV